ncbi:uncharacterized protein LOC143580189 [Bidens hawaiensis]|uniref:uncharacterized protein LOC143580189 n=1 Tax=Bidens hawaiensis TaxID=980011 RepID=UPI00404B2A41
MGDDTKTAADKTGALHPIYMVTNIQQRVRTLDGTKLTYSSWDKLFQLHAHGYDVLNHIDDTVTPKKTDPSYATWVKIDSIVLQWIYATILDILLESILKTEYTALEAWNRLKRIFFTKKGPRAAALETEFCSLKLQNFLSIEAYCQQIKEVSNQLSDVGIHMNDKCLVIQLVNGLLFEYDATELFINQAMPT